MVSKGNAKGSAGARLHERLSGLDRCGAIDEKTLKRCKQICKDGFKFCEDHTFIDGVERNLDNLRNSDGSLSKYGRILSGSSRIAQLYEGNRNNGLLRDQSDDLAFQEAIIQLSISEIEAKMGDEGLIEHADFINELMSAKRMTIDSMAKTEKALHSTVHISQVHAIFGTITQILRDEIIDSAVLNKIIKRLQLIEMPVPANGPKINGGEIVDGVLLDEPRDISDKTTDKKEIIEVLTSDAAILYKAEKYLDRACETLEKNKAKKKAKKKKNKKKREKRLKK